MTRHLSLTVTPDLFRGKATLGLAEGSTTPEQVRGDTEFANETP
jgi:hypothetical protein